MSSIMDDLFKEGEEEKAAEIAIKMILRGKLSLEEIAEDTNLTLEDVQELAKEVKPVSV